MDDPIRILYVDDSRHDRELVQDALEREDSGFALTLAASRAEFEVGLARGEFDLVLSDFNILGFEGLQVVDAVHAKDPETPVVIVTGTGSEEVAVKALKQGAADYVIKTPAHILHLPVTIRSVLATKRAQRERQQAQDALRESESRFRMLVEEAADTIIVHDQNGRIIMVNAMACSTLGYTREELLSLDVKDIDESVASDDYKSRIWNLQGDQPITIETTHRRKDGSTYPAEVRLVRFGHAGWPVIMGVVRDVTERVRAEEERRRLEAQVQHAQRLESLGILAGGIAHDFNNLLAVVVGNAEMALDDIHHSSPARLCLDEIQKTARRATELCRQMLAYSGKGRFVLESINLNDAVKEMAHLLDVSISKKASLKFKLSETAPVIEGDPAQISQVILNLITNASESLGERSGVISVATGVLDCDRAYLEGPWLAEPPEPGPYAYFEVSDTGDGMTLDTLSKIFDPFFTTKFTGRGLGLAAVLGIVRGHRGAIKVDSEVGMGSTFRVLLPALPVSAAEKKPAQSDADRWQGQGRVLLVDDEESLLKILKLMVERLGFSVTTASNGRQAITLLGEQPDAFRLVLLDFTMPDMDGEETFVELRRIRPDIPIILASGYSEQDIGKRFEGKGLSGFVHKPYTREALMTVVRGVLEGPDAV